MVGVIKDFFVRKSVWDSRCSIKCKRNNYMWRGLIWIFLSCCQQDAGGDAHQRPNKMLMIYAKFIS